MSKCNSDNKEMTVSDLMGVLLNVPENCVVKIVKQPMFVASISDQCPIGYNITGTRYTRCQKGDETHEVFQIIW